MCRASNPFGGGGGSNPFASKGSTDPFATASNRATLTSQPKPPSPAVHSLDRGAPPRVTEVGAARGRAQQADAHTSTPGPFPREEACLG